MKKLFSAAAKGIRVAILSGDAHVSAAFVLKDKKTTHLPAHVECYHQQGPLAVGVASAPLRARQWRDCGRLPL